MAAATRQPETAAGAGTRPILGWYRTARVKPAFVAPGRSDAAVVMAVSRWREALPAAQKRQVNGRWQVRGDATLPAGAAAPGVRLQEFVGAEPAAPVPDAAHGAPSLATKTQNARDAYRIDQWFQRTCQYGPTTDAYFQALDQVHGDALRRLGFAPTRGVFRRLRARVPAGEVVDQRAVKSGRPPTAIDERIRDAYDSIVMHPNHDTDRWAEAWRCARDVAQELGLAMPSRQVMRRDHKRRKPELARVYTRRPKAFVAECVPKVARNYDEIAPLEWVSLDGHVLNHRCQAPDAAKSGRAIRPVLTAVLDVRTRMFVGDDLRAHENADGILAGLARMHDEFGCAQHYYCDCGEAYKAGIGRRIETKLFRDPRIKRLADEVGATVHNALPYQGWAKMIESHWRHVVESFSRHFASWWGNRIEARPEDAAKLPVWKLPTLDQVRECWRLWKQAHHDEPQQGHGMYGLSPNEAMRQFAVEVRRLPKAVVRFLSSRVIGHRLVRRDGVTINGIPYGQTQESVAKLYGTKVQVRIDPADASYVWLFDHASGELVLATNRRLSGASQEDIREARRHETRLKRLARELGPRRDYLRENTTEQIMRRKADCAAARAAARQEHLPPAAAPAVTIVRGDLVAPVERAEKVAAQESVRPAIEGRSKGVPSIRERLRRVGEEAPARTAGPSLGDIVEAREEEAVRAPTLAEFGALCASAEDEDKGPSYAEMAG